MYGGGVFVVNPAVKSATLGRDVTEVKKTSPPLSAGLGKWRAGQSSWSQAVKETINPRDLPSLFCLLIVNHFVICLTRTNMPG